MEDRAIKGRLLLLSFLMLFVELALIRWTGSNVVYLSYFSNFVLLGSFLGIGVGFLRARASFDLFPWAVVLLAVLVGFVLAFPVTVDRAGSSFIYFGVQTEGLPMWVVLPAIFAMVAIVMAAIAQGVAATFAQFEPLEAYRLDILGSLAGIAAFSLLSFLGAPPLAWAFVACLAFAVLYGRSLRLPQVAAAISILVLLGAESFKPHYYWSPYYKVAALPYKTGQIALEVNGIPHQWIASLDQVAYSAPIYFLPYKRIVSNPLDDVLIVGAGNGVDVAVALASNARHVDAIEIDPRIYQLGRQLNPNHPYADPRVTIHIDDGRAFLQRTHRRYDLILFALPDSLTLVTGQSWLRLESYLFTVESIRAAREHLRPDGAFGMYNMYREDWLIDRFAGTVQSVFGYPPCIDSVGTVGRFALLIVGRQPGNVACTTVWKPSPGTIAAPVSDDRPFPYLRDRTIPWLYLVTIALVLAVSALAIRLGAGSLTGTNRYTDLFFMGAAFLLLETKSVVVFALLFGTTWLVNAMVFFGILLAVLAAIEVARRVRVRNPATLYLALCASLAVAWAVEPWRLLALDVPARLTIAIVLTFTPVFLANLIFSGRFRDVSASTIAFGTNLLGAMVGGTIEYLSLVVGYRSLLLVVAALYTLAFLTKREQSQEESVLADTAERAAAT
jgi:hypothetical protein